MTPTPPKTWLIDFALLAAIWGSSFMFMRLGAIEFGPFPTAGLRVMIGTLVLLPLLWMRGLGAELLRHWKITMAVGLINSAIPFACFTFALLSISSGLASILNSSVPLFGAIVAWLWFKDRPDNARILGLMIGFFGVALLAWDKVVVKSDTSTSSTVWAVLACLTACLCYAIAASVARRFMVGLPSLVSATGSQIGASLALLPLTLAYWPQHALPLRAWLSVLALGVLCTGFAYVLYFRLIERAGPVRALAVTFLIPVFAILFGLIFLGETVTPWMLFCGLVIVVGTSLSTGLIKPGRNAAAT